VTWNLTPTISRRAFLAAAAAAPAALEAAEAVVDIHQHTNYTGRDDATLIEHQRRMGVAKTVLLPAGRRFGLAAAAYGNESCLAIVKQHPGQYYFFANEAPYADEAGEVIEKYLELGAIGIGEQKFHILCDSPYIDRIARIAADYKVPILMHFEHGAYNTGIERFHNVLEKHPRVNFIGHAQTWWGNIDAKLDRRDLYPKTKVTPGGISDRLLADYPNMFGDLSAGSGNNALTRDEDHAREFLKRHQDKLLFGSDCNDREGQGENCIGTRTLAVLRRLAPDGNVLQKILAGNAHRIMRLT
jgi:uncharacterized protein